MGIRAGLAIMRSRHIPYTYRESNRGFSDIRDIA